MQYFISYLEADVDVLESICRTQTLANIVDFFACERLVNFQIKSPKPKTAPLKAEIAEHLILD